MDEGASTLLPGYPIGILAVAEAPYRWEWGTYPSTSPQTTVCMALVFSSGTSHVSPCTYIYEHWILAAPNYATLDTLKVLWSSVVKLAKKFNSTSFNLKQEAFIRGDEDWPEEGWYLYRNWIDTFEITRWTVNFNIHTSYGGWLICDQCHCRCEKTHAIKSWSVMTHFHTFVINFEMKEMTLLNSCQVIKSWPIWILIVWI